MRFLEWSCSDGSQKEFLFAGREKTDDVWIGGGGSGGSGEYDCAHQTALYNTRNKKCLPESPLLLLLVSVIFSGARLAGLKCLVLFFLPIYTQWF